MKKILTLIIFCSILVGCAKSNEVVITGNDKDQSKTYCESMLSSGRDLNLNGCFYPEMENGIQSLVYVPDGLVKESGLTDFNILDKDVEKPEDYNPHYHINVYKTFVSQDNANPQYFADVLNSFLFSETDGFKFRLGEDSESEVYVFLPSESLEEYANRFLPEPHTPDLAGSAQVLYQAAADTIYANFPEVSAVIFDINYFMDICPITDGVFVDRETMLPLLFGSQYNFIGNLSYEDYKAKLEESGVHFDNYYDHRDLKVVNNWVYTGFLGEQ